MKSKQLTIVFCLVTLAITGCSTGSRPRESEAAPAPASIDEFLDLIHVDEVLDRLRHAHKEVLEARFAKASAKSRLTSTQATVRDEFNQRLLLLIDNTLTDQRMRQVLGVTMRGSFSQRDIDALSAFYRTQAGKSVVEHWRNSIGPSVKERQAHNLAEPLSDPRTAHEPSTPMFRIFRMAADSKEIVRLYGADIDEDILSRLPKAELIYDRETDAIEAELQTALRGLTEDYRAKMKNLAVQ